MTRDDLIDAGKHALDGASVLAVLGTLAKLLPPVAALLTIIWTGIRIYESDTYKKLFGKTQ